MPLTKASKRFRVGLKCDHTRTWEQAPIERDGASRCAYVQYSERPLDVMAQDGSFGRRLSRD